MEKTIVGFQYDPKTGRYIGEYEFPDNMDRQEIHMPPNTTLERPPETTEGKMAVMVEGVWQIQEDPSAHKVRPPMGDYLMLTEDFIAFMIEQGMWTEEDQIKRDTAIAENEIKVKEFEAIVAAQNAAKATGGAE